MVKRSFPSKKLILSFSDIEAGAGTATDDFIEEDLLCRTIRSHFAESKKMAADLIFNGDTFDYMKAPYGSKYPRHITEKISVHKTKTIYKAHKRYFKVMHDWLKASPTNRIIFIVGNHDYDLVFPKVQELLKKLIAGRSEDLKRRILFPGFEFKDGLTLIEHGSQLDHFFQVNPEKFIFYPKDKSKEPYLLLPWGFNAFYDQYVLLKEHYPLLERIVPRHAVFGHLPKHIKKVFVTDTIIYMIKSFFYTQYRFWGDPLHRFTFKEFRNYFRNFFSSEWSVKFIDEAKKRLRKEKIQVICVGHNHRPKKVYLGQKIVLNTGCWRDEYIMGDGFNFPAKPKVYAYIKQTAQKVLDARLIEVASERPGITIEDIRKEIARGDKQFKRVMLLQGKREKNARKVAQRVHNRLVKRDKMIKKRQAKNEKRASKLAKKQEKRAAKSAKKQSKKEKK